jgi:hypothetical protein
VRKTRELDEMVVMTAERHSDDTDEVMWAQEEATKCLELAMSLGDPQLPLDLRAAVPDHTMRSKILNEGRLEECKPIPVLSRSSLTLT